MFYRDYLGKQWALWERFEIRRDHPLPVVLTRKENRQAAGQRTPREVFARCSHSSTIAGCEWARRSP
jgi:hypothetical protein